MLFSDFFFLEGEKRTRIGTPISKVQLKAKNEAVIFHPREKYPHLFDVHTSFIICPNTSNFSSHGSAKISFSIDHVDKSRFREHQTMKPIVVVGYNKLDLI